MRTMLLGAALVILASGAVAQAQDQEARIARLIQDLGAEKFETREAADQELRKIGAAAIPQLKKAMEDPDAERADRARKILADVERNRPARDRKGSAFGFRVLRRDLTSGVTFELHPDGRVELTVPEEDPDSGKKVYKTYRAESLEAFKERHPEIAKRYAIDTYVPRLEFRPLEPGQFDDWWKDWKKRFDEEFDLERLFKDWNAPFQPDALRPFEFEDLQSWLEEHRKRIEELRRRLRPFEGERATPGGKSTRPAEGKQFGIRVEPVGETLAAQLDLQDGEGVQVTEVTAGSLAERAGLRKHDIILKVDGKAVTNGWEFRRNIRELAGTSFELTIVRAGKRETVQVKGEE